MDIEIKKTTITLQGTFDKETLQTTNIEQLPLTESKYSINCDQLGAINSYFLVWLIELIRYAQTNNQTITLKKDSPAKLIRLIELYRLKEIISFE